MPLSKQEEDKAREIFDAIDADGSGKISPDNIRDGLEQAGFVITDEEAEAVIGLVDADGTGEVSFEEWCKVVESRPIKSRIEKALRALFDAFDTDGSGCVTADDIRKLVDEAGFGDDISDDEIKALIDGLDTEGNGKVSFEEFLGALVG